jgi:hypothetical protein
LSSLRRIVFWFNDFKRIFMVAIPGMECDQKMEKTLSLMNTDHTDLHGLQGQCRRACFVSIAVLPKEGACASATT